MCLPEDLEDTPFNLQLAKLDHEKDLIFMIFQIQITNNDF